MDYLLLFSILFVRWLFVHIEHLFTLEVYFVFQCCFMMWSHTGFHIKKQCSCTTVGDDLKVLFSTICHLLFCYYYAWCIGLLLLLIGFVVMGFFGRIGLEPKNVVIMTYLQCFTTKASAWEYGQPLKDDKGMKGN